MQYVPALVPMCFEHSFKSSLSFIHTFSFLKDKRNKESFCCDVLLCMISNRGILVTQPWEFSNYFIMITRIELFPCRSQERENVANINKNCCCVHELPHYWREYNTLFSHKLLELKFVMEHCWLRNIIRYS